VESLKETVNGIEFVGPREVQMGGFELNEPEEGEVVVESSLSVVSSGTEKLLYRGEVPTVESDTPGVGELEYPTRYGYSIVGEVIETQGGTELDEGECVHVMHPHQSRFVVHEDSVRSIPDGVTEEEAIHLPNTETAVSLVMDGRPIVGERVGVFGQGVVGLLTTAVLSSFPIEVVTFDPVEKRRRRSERMGADRSHAPEELESVRPEEGYDLVYEVSGNPEALEDAVGATGYDGRVVVGSWYGTSSASVSLGVSFHGEDIDISDSQVSDIAPGLRGRWTKGRRLGISWEFIDKINVSGLITGRFGIEEAQKAYEAVDSGELSVVFEYE